MNHEKVASKVLKIHQIESNYDTSWPFSFLRLVASMIFIVYSFAFKYIPESIFVESSMLLYSWQGA